MAVAQKPVVAGNGQYTAPTIARAREHYEAGWKLSEITVLIERETGRRPHWRTVKAWVDPKWASRQRKRMRPVERRSQERRHGRRFREMSQDWKLARMRELHDRGLSFFGISVVASVWWGEVLSEDTVARRLRRKPRGRTYRKTSVVGANDNNEELR